MIDVVERLVAKWFAITDHGVNAIAAELPRDCLMPRPDGAMVDDPPPAVAIYSAADTPSVAASLEPASAPALVIKAIGDATAAAKGYRIAKTVDVAAYYMVDDGADPFTANRDAGYIMRAAKLSMARFNSYALAKAFRTLNDVVILDVVEIIETRATESTGRYKCPALLVIRLTAADTFGGPTPTIGTA